MTKRTKVERMTPKNLRAFRIEGGDRILSALQPPQYREIHAKGTHANSQASFSPRLSCSYPTPRCSGSIMVLMARKLCYLSDREHTVGWSRFASLKDILFGKPKDPLDPKVFHQISLIAFLAWVGLGADGLSSSAYGPEEAYLALGQHYLLALPLA